MDASLKLPTGVDDERTAEDVTDLAALEIVFADFRNEPL